MQPAYVNVSWLLKPVLLFNLRLDMQWSRYPILNMIIHWFLAVGVNPWMASQMSLDNDILLW